jgi:exonuclease VII small subunit
LEDSIKKYQYAVELYKKAQKQLKESEIKIEEIRGSLEDV